MSASSVVPASHLESSFSELPGLRARHNGLERPYDLTDNEMLERQRRLESNARTYPRRIPLALTRGRGIYVEDVKGRVFIDCLAGAGALALGHNHPAIREAIERALRDELPMQTLDLMTPAKDRFMQELFELLPPELARRGKIQFCGPSGSDAVEASLKLVKTATRRTNMLAFHGAYHGMSQGALAMMGSLKPKLDIGALGQVQFLPFPYSYRCPFGIGGEAGETAGLRYIHTVLHDPESGVVPPAGVILEAVQGEGGVVPASERWLAELRRMTRDAGVPMILDEVQTGLGRTGRMFAFQHADIVPDVLVLSKAFGGGLPLAVVVYDEALDKWQPGAHAGTFRGNQLAMVAGAATMRIARTERLELHAEAMGQRLRGHLLELQRRYACIGDVRGRGLMLGMELVGAAGAAPGAPPAADPAVASALQRACLQRGLIIELGGRHGSVVRFLPPLIITEKEIDHVVEILDASLRTVAREAA